VWVGLAVLIKLALFFYTMVLANTHNRSGEVRLYLSSGDEADYLMPVENLVRHGWYVIDLADPSTGVRRMPGYAVSYLPFRYLLGPEGGVVAQVAFQVILGGIAAYGAASLALAISGRFLVFLLTLGLGSFSLTSSIFDAYTRCDGLAASVLTLCVWALVHPTKLARSTLLVCGGALFAYAVFLRPFLAPLGLVLAILVWATCTGPKWRQLLLFASVPVLCEGAWIGRNWLLLGRFVPLQTAGYEFPASERAVRDWIGSFGGDLIHWRPGSAGAWVHQRSPYAPASAPLPAQAYTTTCPSNRIVAATELYRQSRREDNPVRRTWLEKEVTTLFTECREAYESEHPLDHHLTARLRLLKAFFIHAGPVLPLPLLSTLPGFSGAVAFKIWAAASYAGILLFAVPGLALLLCRFRGPAAVAVASIPIYIVCLFPLGLRFVETRELAVAWPFLCLAASAALASAIDRSPVASIAKRMSQTT
jgi:hypothetical protein